jgi:DNA-3-methyladenine glycosylase
MFGPAGHVYMYFTYGVHWMFNIVTGRSGAPGAVLVRALAPLEGEAGMARRRAGRPRRDWTNGPAKLAQALALDGRHNGACLFAPDGVIWVESAPAVAPEQMAAGPRIGLGNVPEPWLSMPWRFWVRDEPFVSRKTANLEIP